MWSLFYVSVCDWPEIHVLNMWLAGDSKTMLSPLHASFSTSLETHLCTISLIEVRPIVLVTSISIREMVPMLVSKDAEKLIWNRNNTVLLSLTNYRLTCEKVITRGIPWLMLSSFHVSVSPKNGHPNMTHLITTYVKFYSLSH